ncbi:MAG: helix-turn-helix transcriptional regulator [Bacteriovoracaceae bacterium]|nr:helix-turn-helix transcriptional regulator [Bacteriovoracaceae bacterium]
MKTDESLQIDNINTPKKAGLALKRLRKQQNHSQADLAKMMNMRQPTISDVESGKGTLESFFKIVQALKLNLELSSPGTVKAKLSSTSKVRAVLNYLNEV